MEIDGVWRFKKPGADFLHMRKVLNWILPICTTSEQILPFAHSIQHIRAFGEEANDICLYITYVVSKTNHFQSYTGNGKIDYSICRKTKAADEKSHRIPDVGKGRARQTTRLACLASLSIFYEHNQNATKMTTTSISVPIQRWMLFLFIHVYSSAKNVTRHVSEWIELNSFACI